MKTIFAIFIFSSLTFYTLNVFAQTTENSEEALKQRFIEKHNAMIPVVAVADIFFACNRQRHSEDYDYQITDLVNKMERNKLAEKLSTCLAGDSLKSDVAINFGLIGCFHSQMNGLNQKMYDEKMGQLELLLLKLPRAERQKTLTKCVSEQALYFLK